MPVPETTAEFIDVSGRRLHVLRIGTGLEGTPLVFLHEGLGSVELWRGFPAAVVNGSAHPAFLYSRYGNGWSTALAGPRQADYLHAEALETLPEVVHHHVGDAPILIGHSDGASIALIYAGAGHPVRGLVLLAPHVFVEDLTIASISALRESFPTSDMPTKMAKYHRDPDSTFLGWADVWLSGPFHTWSIEQYVSGVACPTLLIAGNEDDYGTMRQLDAIDAGLGAPARRLVVDGAGHSPHLSHPEPVIDAVVEFIATV